MFDDRVRGASGKSIAAADRAGTRFLKVCIGMK
jgi:hypothetical protein